MYCYTVLPLDLHVLSLSLAFILSQDQTLRCSNCFLISLARIPSLIVVQGLSLDGTHRYTRFRFLYYLSYYVSILKDRFRNHRRFSIAGAKVRLFFIPPNFFAKFFQSFFCRFSHYLRTTTLIAGRIPHCSR